MERKIILSADGSHTVAIPEQNLIYHSHHGALQESRHVFIEAGLHHFLNSRKMDEGPIRIFEMGFGTGLNALLTALEAAHRQIPIYYTAVETAPLTANEASALNYPSLVGGAAVFQQLHQAAWNKDIIIHPHFSIRKQNVSLQDFSSQAHFHVIYYDAFAPSAQPELWTETIFRKLFKSMQPGGILVTYCSKGAVRRALQAAGFEVKKIPGPPGKREIVRASVKTNAVI